MRSIWVLLAVFCACSVGWGQSSGAIVGTVTDPSGAQGTIKASSRPTLDLGLRYEPFLPWQEIYNWTKLFRPDAFYAGQRSQVFLNAPPGMFFPGDPGVPVDGTTSDLNNLAPRVGFAWDVLGDSKTRMRAAGCSLVWETCTSIRKTSTRRSNRTRTVIC